MGESSASYCCNNKHVVSVSEATVAKSLFWFLSNPIINCMVYIMLHHIKCFEIKVNKNEYYFSIICKHIFKIISQSYFLNYKLN